MATHILIQTITVSASSQAAIEFTSIPQTYTDLYVVLSARGTTADLYSAVSMKFNSSAGDNSIYTQGNGVSTSAASFSGLFGFISAATASSNLFANGHAYIPNYTSSLNKTFSADVICDNNVSSGGTYQVFSAGYWANTAPITSIKFVNIFGGDFTQYSTASLYGIKNS